MTFNHSKLLGLMREYGYTQETLAKAIGISESTLNIKLKGKAYFTSTEIDRICELLSIPNEEIGLYFFTPMVWKSKPCKEV